jgi:hypothetical protein
MLKPHAQKRLEKLTKDLIILGLEHPVAEIAKHTKSDKSNVSAFLSGKKPIGAKWFARFYSIYREEINRRSAEIELPRQTEIKKETAEDEAKPSCKIDLVDVTIARLEKLKEIQLDSIKLISELIEDIQKDRYYNTPALYTLLYQPLFQNAGLNKSSPRIEYKIIISSRDKINSHFQLSK